MIRRAAPLAAFAVVALFATQALADPILVDYRGVYRQSAPGVVLIAAMMDQNTGSTGTGSIITRAGHVITNAHVVVNPQTQQLAPRVFIFLRPDRVTGQNENDLRHQYQARVLQHDNALDLALLQIVNPPPTLTLIPFQDSELVEIGAPTIAIGHPEQGVRWTMTTGAISGMIVNFNQVAGKNVFQMETSVNRGNSGGPLLDHLGNMVGINSMIARQGAGGIAITDVNFAIQSNVARDWLARYGIRNEAPAQPYEWQRGAVAQAQVPPAQAPAAPSAPPQAQAVPVAPTPPPQPAQPSDPLANTVPVNRTPPGQPGPTRPQPTTPPPQPTAPAAVAQTQPLPPAERLSPQVVGQLKAPAPPREPPPPSAQPQAQPGNRQAQQQARQPQAAQPPARAPEQRNDRRPPAGRSYDSLYENVRPGQTYTPTEIEQLRERARQFRQNNVRGMEERMRNQRQRIQRGQSGQTR